MGLIVINDNGSHPHLIYSRTCNYRKSHDETSGMGFPTAARKSHFRDIGAVGVSRIECIRMQ